MHSSLQSLAFPAVCSEDYPLSPYVKGVLERAPGLTKLEVRSHHAVREVQDDLLLLFRGLSELRHVILPLYFLTSAMLAELSKAPKLETIELSDPVENGLGNSGDVQEFRPILETGAFPSLRTLGFAAQVRHAARFLKDKCVPSHISALRLLAVATDDPPAVRQLFDAVASRFTQLTEFHVDFLLGPSSPIVSPPPPADARLSLNTLRPLTACSGLVILKLRWNYQLHLTDSDLDILAPSWPSLEVLHLHSEPIPELTAPLLSARALLPFARHCPRLHSLALYIDGDAAAPLPAPDTPVAPFRALRTLAFGSSPLSAAEPMALFLSMLCPPQCVVSAGVRWPDAYGIALDRAGVMDDRRQRMAEWWARWGEVARLLPLMAKACVDERTSDLARAGQQPEEQRAEEKLRG